VAAAAAAAAGGSSTAVMSPAVLLADSIGRAVDSRVKFLRHKHQQQELQRLRRGILHRHRKQQQQQQQDLLLELEGPEGQRLQQSLERYTHSHGKEAAAYQAGQQKLQQLEELRKLGAAARKSASAAQVSQR